MRKFALLLTCFLFIGMQLVLAQSRTITGTVTDADDGSTLPGVSVVVKGTSVGTVTDVNGEFSLSAPSDAETLVFSFVGMQEKEVTIGSASSYNVMLEQSDIAVDEVVVTALGIKRSEKAIGYATAKVSGEELAKARNANVVNSLSGKVAGVQVQTTSSDPGAATSVVIRGFGSINGNNQPLYVVDGVPLQNSTLSTQGHSVNLGGISSVANDDIESMSILKGAAASALYGSRASNGVVIITTKQGKKSGGRNYSLTYNGGLQLRQISSLPTFQNDFGQGWNGGQTYIENGSWGARLDGSTQVYGPIWNNQQLIHEYSALENNVKDFFEIGVSNSHNLSISGASEDEALTYYLSYTHSSDDGIMPSDVDTYDRDVLAYRSTFKGDDWITVSSSMNLSTTKNKLVGQYQGTSVVDGLYEFPRDISVIDLEDITNPFNTPEAYFTPYGITNPYWAIANNQNEKNVKKVYGKMQVDINPISDLTLTYRFGFDYTDYDRKVGFPEIELDDALINDDKGYAPKNMNQDGWVYGAYGRFYETNHDFLASYDKGLGAINLTLNGGVNINERGSTSMGGQVDGLTFNTGFYDFSNGATISSLSENQYKRRLVGVFGDAVFGYDDMIFLNVVARNDWSSTLPAGNNNYFYPGVTLSYVFSEMIPENDVLTFGKLRMAYGKTGNDAGVYLTSTDYEQAYSNGYYGLDIARFPMNGANAFILGTIAGSAELKPEMTSETELGVDLKFFNNRIGLDASLYNRITSDQIFELPVDPSTGFTTMVTNFGEVQNKGFEVLLSTTPVKTKNVVWNIDFNFAMNKSEVLSMPESLEGGKVSVNDFSAGNDAVYMYAEVGKPMGRFYTYLPQYVEDKNSEFYGALIVDADGLPDYGDEVEDTGLDMNNKWVGGVSSTLTAYGVSLSATLDARYGGTMFSRTKNLMHFTGNGIATTYNDRNPFIVPNSAVQTGTDSEGNPVYAENTSVIKTSDGTFQNYLDLVGSGDGGLYLLDRSYAKLRNISISYAIPNKVLHNTKISKVSLTAFVNNAFIWTAAGNHYIDPESTTEGSDLGGRFGELYSNPSSRIYGFNLSITY